MLAGLVLTVLLPFVALSSPVEDRCDALGKGFNRADHNEANLPDELKIDKAEGRLFLGFFATGSQNYVCATATSSWTLVEPKAILLNKEGDTKGVATHYFLPEPDAKGGKATFSSIDIDGCGYVVAKSVQSIPSRDSPTKDINWLKLSMTSTEGMGPFTKARFVLRVNTRGGQPPPEKECGNPRFPDGSVYKSPYQAEYWFYDEPVQDEGKA